MTETNRPGPLTGTTIAVIGAGIVGLCGALHLTRLGASVRIFDPLGPGGGASFGNGGLINIDDVAPIAMPGMLRQVPGWLMDPLGPLHLPPGYAPRAAPWLIRWMLAGRWRQVLRISDALRALHKDAFGEYRALLDGDTFDALFRRTGTLLVWETEAVARSERRQEELRQRHGIDYRALSLDEMLDLMPGISPDIRRAALVPRNGFVTSPARLTERLARGLSAAGCDIRREKVYKIVPGAGSGFTVLTNISNVAVDQVVVAAGAFGNDLLRPLGLKFPLETERGYHLFMRNPSHRIDMPVVHKQKGFGLKTMEDGIRITGTVEFGGNRMPMNEERARILGVHARRLFPGLQCETETMWMGLRPSMPDSLPVIGEIPSRPGLFVAFGHGHYGMIGAPASGRLLGALVARQDPGIDAMPYAPQRFLKAGTA